jgi:hypothetical protein
MIINEVYFEEINQLFDEIHSGVEAVSGYKEKLNYFTEKTFEALIEHREFFANYVRCLESISGNQGTEKMLTTFYDRYSNEFSEILQQGIEHGDFDGVDVGCASRTAYCMLMGSFFLKYSMKIDFDLREQSNTQLEWLMHSAH